MSMADVTVRHHLTSIFSKLEVPDRLSLVVFAYHHALARPSGWRRRPDSGPPFTQ
jgi:DNA-binding NarL/FixJ family response regulator